MPVGIYSLPLELLINVVLYLSLDDFIIFKTSTRHLGRILHNESISHQLVRRLLAHSKEAKRADRRWFSYSEAIQRTFLRREAFALALPYSTVMLGCGTSFIYRGGVLCYVEGQTIRMLEVHGEEVHGEVRAEQVIDLELIGKHVWKTEKLFSHAELLHYQDGVLSFLYRAPILNGQYNTEELWLLAVDVRKKVSTPNRVRLAIIVQNSKFFVRNNGRYLYVGSHDGMGSHGHHEWVLQGYDLSNGQPKQSLQLPDLFGTDLGQTVAFEIHDGYFYALSNQSSFEVEEIDWTSYYHCHRFPLHTPTKETLHRRQIFRRQHREGPINDSWTDLGLNQDERTGNLFITECRREWKNGMSIQQRTYYCEPLPIDFSADGQDPHPIKYPTNDPLVKVLDEKSKALYSESVPRIPRNYHGEPATAAQTFLLAKTKYRSYVPASSAFLDLVIDDHPPRQPASVRLPPRQQLRLRIGSRIQSSPIDQLTERLYKSTLPDSLIPDSEERFTDRQIDLWPPATTPTELLDLLNPAYVSGSTNRMIGDIVAVADERSLVYMPAPLVRQEGENRPIVLVNFDSTSEFRGLPLMRLKLDGGEGDEVGREVIMREDRVDTTKQREIETPAVGKDARMQDDERKRREIQHQEWWREEGAMYLALAKGFRFEYLGGTKKKKGETEVLFSVKSELESWERSKRTRIHT